MCVYTHISIFKWMPICNWDLGVGIWELAFWNHNPRFWMFFMPNMI